MVEAPAEVPADEKPPILPAAAVIAIMEEMAEKEILLTSRAARKKLLADVRGNEDVKFILTAEAEVAQEVFQYAVRMTKVMAGDLLQSVCAEAQLAPDTAAAIIGVIDAITPQLPYQEG